MSEDTLLDELYEHLHFFYPVDPNVALHEQSVETFSFHRHAVP